MKEEKKKKREEERKEREERMRGSEHERESEAHLNCVSTIVDKGKGDFGNVRPGLDACLLRFNCVDFKRATTSKRSHHVLRRDGLK